MGAGLCIIEPGVPATRGSAWGPVVPAAFKAVRRAVTPSEVGSTPTRFRQQGISLARRDIMRGGVVPLTLAVHGGAWNIPDDAVATREGAELCDIDELLVGRELERYLRVVSGERDLVDREFDPDGHGSDGPLGTVGAVALDGRGHLAAATSTGGTQNKAAGRLGDTPVIGAGTYADDRGGAASATGWGEGILRVLPTKMAVDLMGEGLDPDEAGARALSTLDRVGGKGGLLLVGRDGRVSLIFNTPRMARGCATEFGGLTVAVEPLAPH